MRTIPLPREHFEALAFALHADVVLGRTKAMMRFPAQHIAYVCDLPAVDR